MDRRNNEPALYMNPGKKKSNTYRVKNERFAAPGEYLPKKDEESDRDFIEGEKKKDKAQKVERKKKGDKEIFNKERDNQDAINQVSI